MEASDGTKPIFVNNRDGIHTRAGDHGDPERSAV